MNSNSQEISYIGKGGKSVRTDKHPQEMTLSGIGDKMKRKKIGVLTFSPVSLNPGTIFVAWSLCHHIEKYPDFDTDLIFYETWNRKVINHGKISLSNLWFKYTTWRTRDFPKKINKYPLKELYRENISSINGRYDIIIVGGDQVWNPKLTNFDKTYFLDFVNDKTVKAAYAPSIGDDDWPKENKEEIGNLLRNFNFIGIREKQSILAVRELTGKTVHWSIDPTFLINKEEWYDVAHFPKERKESYIMEYCINPSPILVNAIKMATHNLSIPAIECYGGRKRVPMAIKKRNVGADKWLGYILNSKLVITDSFHAVAFCINNNKPFYAIITKNGNRILSVLELFGLGDRVISGEGDIDFTKEIDWEPVNRKLKEVREESQTWLWESLSKALNL